MKSLLNRMLTSRKPVTPGFRHNVLASLVLMLTGCVIRHEQVNFSQYPHITSASLQFDHYEIKQVMNGPANDKLLDSEQYDVYHDAYTGDFFGYIKEVIPGEKGTSYGSLIIRIDTLGHVADTFSHDGPMMIAKNGMMFDDDHYYDWVRSKKQSPKQYNSITNQQDELSLATWETTFKDFYKQASEVYFTTDVMKNRSISYFHTDAGWDVLYSPENNQATRFTWQPDADAILNHYPGYPQKTVYPFTELDNYFSSRPFYDWKDSSQLISMEGFKRLKHQRKNLIPTDIPGPKSGYHGKAAYVLRHQGELLRFSAYGFENKSAPGKYSGDMRIFVPEKSTNSDLLFINLAIPPYSGRKREEAGLYVVRGK